MLFCEIQFQSIVTKNNFIYMHYVLIGSVQSYYSFMLITRRIAINEIQNLF